MARKPRSDIGNHIYHVINRANSRVRIFANASDYLLLERTLREAQKRTNMRILAYSIMPNHVHFVLYPSADKQLSKFMHWFSTTFTQRWHTKHATTGTGHVFQGRYKSFRIKTDPHLARVLQYVERNALRANLVMRAEQWRWSSLWVRQDGALSQKKMLAPWPIEIPPDYLAQVNELELSEVFDIGIDQIASTEDNNEGVIKIIETEIKKK